MFINKAINDVLGFSCLLTATLIFICTAIMRFHMLKKIEKNIGGKLRIPKDFEQLPLCFGVGRVIVVYFVSRLLSKFGVLWYTNRMKSWNHLLQVDYQLSNFSWAEKLVIVLLFVSITYTAVVAALIYFKIIT